MSLGGDADAAAAVITLLELYAAKGLKSDVPCVANIGPGGAGNYIKIVHNSLEVGMLSALCET